jgi:hypothetical protein
LIPTIIAVQNAAVDAANKGVVNSSKTAAVQVAWLRHMACELLHDVPAGQLQEFQLLQLVTFCLKVCGHFQPYIPPHSSAVEADQHT